MFASKNFSINSIFHQLDILQMFCYNFNLKFTKIKGDSYEKI